MIAPASRKIGKYEILHKLGRGGMADVYLAQDTASNATVALKLIEHAPDQDTRDSIEAERRGAQLQAQLAAANPHVVRIYDSGDADGFFYVAMEYIDGQDLSELMRHGPLTPEFAVDVALAVADTLQSAHNLQLAIGGKIYHGLVHGDIKPRNIRIDARGEVRVLDFGIAKALSLSRRLTRNEFGSVPYASPERLDLGEVNQQSDLWSLAVMLYEMVSGMQPYQAETTERLEKMIRSRIPCPPPPDPCPEPLRRILIKSTAPDPEVRYQTAQEFAEDLAAWRSGIQVRAVTEDLDATRRTSRRDVDETRRTSRQAVSDETRQTPPAGDGSPPKGEAWPPKHTAVARPGVFSIAGRAFGLTVLVGLGWLSWVGISNYLLYQHGQQFEQTLKAEQLTDLNAIWTKWTELSQSHESSLLLRGPRSAVKQKFMAAGDHVVDTYRNGESVKASSWVNARDWFARALSLDPDETVRGKLRLAEGHVARTAGTRRTTADLNLAIEKFNEAQQLLPRSPDPQLGLASVYIYALKDIDKAYEAKREAEKRGHPLGNHENQALADLYLARADRTFWDTRTVRGLPQEKDQIQRARDDYQRALNLYQSIQPYGDSTTKISRIEDSLDSVDSRLHQIEHPGALGVVQRLLHLWR